MTEAMQAAGILWMLNESLPGGLLTWLVGIVLALFAVVALTQQRDAP